MNFELDEDQRAVQDTFARFANEQILPHAAELDQAHQFPREVFNLPEQGGPGPRNREGA